jgi:hypothetical protein
MKVEARDRASIGLEKRGWASRVASQYVDALDLMARTFVWRAAIARQFNTGCRARFGTKYVRERAKSSKVI